jgi:hypothetical protein
MEPLKNTVVSFRLIGHLELMSLLRDSVFVTLGKQQMAITLFIQSMAKISMEDMRYSEDTMNSFFLDRSCIKDTQVYTYHLYPENER